MIGVLVGLTDQLCIRGLVLHPRLRRLPLADVALMTTITVSNVPFWLKPGAVVRIGDDIYRVLSVNGNKVKVSASLEAR